MKVLTPIQISLLRRYKATTPRNFPITKSDKFLATEMRIHLARADTSAIAKWWLHG